MLRRSDVDPARKGWAAIGLSLFVASCGGRTGLPTPKDHARCPARSADCDHNPETGCETDLASDSKGCGACGVACGAGLSCADGECLPDHTIVAIDAMVSTQFARTADGHVYAWGNNEYGKANPDSQEPFILSPQLLKLPEPMVEVKPSYMSFTCGRGRSGHVWCWGYPIFQNQPAGGYFELPGISSAQTLMVSGEGHCILDAFRRGYCWSYNEWEELATGSGEPVPKPPRAPVEMVRVDTNVVTLLPSLAAIEGGNILTWGYSARLGASTPPPLDSAGTRFEPAPIPGLVDPVRVEGGKLGNCATLRSGQVYCWGQELQGGQESFVPFLAFENGPYKKVAVSLDLCALRTDGQVECHLETDTNAELANVRDISAGIASLCLLTQTFGVVCKGDNSEAQLGVGVKGGPSAKELIPLSFPPID